MTVVVRLETLVELDAGDPRHMSVAACHEAVLDDGRRVHLLDRGWGTALTPSGPDDAEVLWAMTSVADVEREARTVVGPDEPFGEHTQADMAASHWAYLVWELRHQGVVADADELRRLPHDVLLGDRLRARIGA